MTPTIETVNTDGITLVCSKRSHYSALGLSESDLSRLPPPLLQLLEVSVERLYNHQMIAASRFEGESVSKLSKATNLELKTVHLYVDILEID